MARPARGGQTARVTMLLRSLLRPAALAYGAVAAALLATVVVVPLAGAFEIPLAARRIAEQGGFDAVVCLGAVIEGATDHHEYVAGNAAAGIARESAAADVPMTFGIITASSIEQAIERAGTKQGNLGWSAALSALELSNVLRRIDEVAEQREDA